MNVGTILSNFALFYIHQKTGDVVPNGSLLFDSIPCGNQLIGRVGGTDYGVIVSDITDSSTLGRYQKLLRFALRFHLAVYLINGRYPTIFHRIFGVSYDSATNVSDAPNYKTVAVLMLLESISDVGHYSTCICFKAWKGLTNLVEKCHEQIFPSARRSVASGSIQSQIYERIPSFRSSFTSKESSPSCMVCGGLRSRPSGMATKCGHIFCWDCILTWTRKKPECPYCRSYCPPQNVLAVYNF